MGELLLEKNKLRLVPYVKTMDSQVLMRTYCKPVFDIDTKSIKLSILYYIFFDKRVSIFL